MNIIKELRKKKGIQQKELALAIGVSRPTVSDWEANKKDPTGERLKKLADFFDVDELVILGKGVVDLTDHKNLFIPEDPKVSGVSETEQIVQHVLEKLNIQPAATPEIRIVSGAMEKMSKEQQEQVVNVVKAMFANHPELFN